MSAMDTSDSSEGGNLPLMCMSRTCVRSQKALQRAMPGHPVLDAALFPTSFDHFLKVNGLRPF